MAQLPSAFSCHLSSVASSEVPLAWTAKSMMVVVPPCAAAFVPVANVSTENVPPNGISMCVCASMPPGITYFPVASMTMSAPVSVASAAAVTAAYVAVSVASSRASTAAIFSPTTSTSAGSVPSAVTTVPPLISVLTEPPARLKTRARSWLYQRLVGVRPAVPVELPQVPDLGQLVHVEVAHDDRVGVVGGDVADELAARVDEVRLAVEVVVAERLDADPVDRADVVLVGHRGRGLLQLPQVGAQPARGRRRVEHDLRAGQAERPPALREVPVVADVDADPPDGGVEHR